MDNLKYDGIRFWAFPKCNRHFDEFIFHEKLVWKMEDFQAFALLFGGGATGGVI